MDKLVEKIDGKSMDILSENISKIKEIFPEVFCEEKIDFEKLKEALGEYIDDKEEKYSFTWHGKSKAIRLSQTPSTGTLRPCKEESKNWDTTENLYIEGDNLEVLKLLQKTYHGRVKMIYIDPPYNTGNDFVYPDDYKDNLQNYLEITGQVNEEGKKLGTNSEAGGRYHTNWLNMMYPRLRLARNLLTDDGVIFISTDDNEVHNLRKICDEILGEENFLGEIIVQSNKGGQDYKDLARTHEYLSCYGKGASTTLYEIEKEDANLKYKDNKGSFDIRELRNRNPKFGKFNRPNLFYPIYVNKTVCDENGLYSVSLSNDENYDIEVFPLNSEGKESCWRWGKDKFNKNNNSSVANADVVAKPKNTGGWNVYEKYRKTTQKVKTIWDETGVRTENGTIQLREISLKGIFDHPKPIDVIEKCLKISVDNEDIIVDFFSGSSTTAHAVMQLNAEDGGNRKFIMVQLPESTEEKSEAYKAGYKNICEIGKERIRRAGDKILEENKNKDGIENLDIGFKVFKLDSSNIKKWNPDYNDFNLTLDLMVDNFVPNRKEEDILYEVMLKFGIDLTYPIEEHHINGKNVYSIGFGALFACFDDDITLEVSEGIIKLKEELSPEITRVVFKDNGFKDSCTKKNIELTLKRNNIKDVMSI